MKNKISILKSIKTKLLNKNCKSEKEFEETQNKLNEVELLLKLEKTREK